MTPFASLLLTISATLHTVYADLPTLPDNLGVSKDTSRDKSPGQVDKSPRYRGKCLKYYDCSFTLILADFGAMLDVYRLLWVKSAGLFLLVAHFGG